MFSRVMFSVLFGTLLIIAIIPDTASYNKYGRTCQDIGCRSDETCVMAEDPCTGYSDKCGRYPTCQRTSGASCTTMICGENEYCKTENGAPKCVKKSTGLGYESAGVSYVNGERVSGNNANSNGNPYANANAPPPEPPYPSNVDHRDHHQSSYGSNLGYPPYPNNAGSSASGYPPQTNQAGRHQDLGYPPYPTQNRMPMPGQPMYPQQNAGYPPQQNYPQQNAGYPPQHNYPQQYPGQNHPYQNYPNQPQRGYNHPNSIYRKNAASVGTIASMILVGFSGLFPFLLTRW
ncbi:hypothetical protein EAG_14954 [Camponotus floridanus]|uniref:Translation initiation factor IF-2 n=1 Tax=Camponotus floridanus TaxID=104421 RepID=E2AD19_CAMFO|nr:hypothetical protein EAG_14954 [Camponotus floridanus]